MLDNDKRFDGCACDQGDIILYNQGMTAFVPLSGRTAPATPITQMSCIPFRVLLSDNRYLSKSIDTPWVDFIEPLDVPAN